MSSREEHVHRAEQDDVFFQVTSRGEPAHLHWAVVALFYSALHYVEAVLFPSHSSSHADRNRRISIHPDLRPLFPAYYDLYQRSLDARYETRSFSAEDVRDVKDNLFLPVRSHIRQLLGLSELDSLH